VSALNKENEGCDASLGEGDIRRALRGAWPASRPNPAVLVHGDLWPGNVLWRDKRIVGILDWEDAALGDPLSDIAISRLDLLWAFGLEAMEAFTRACRERMRVSFSTLPYWDLVAALRPAGHIGEWASAWAEVGRGDVTEATMRAGHKLFVARALESLGGRSQP
jgi:aminoglycoside phosphotransferase (APT) family kinase protein